VSTFRGVSWFESIVSQMIGNSKSPVIKIKAQWLALCSHPCQSPQCETVFPISLRKKCVPSLT
jgi:hypothetical protein